MALGYLVQIEQGIRVLAWQKTDDANPKRPSRHYPRRLPLTREEWEAHELETRRLQPAGPAPSLDQVKEWLGWETNPKALRPAHNTPDP